MKKNIKNFIVALLLCFSFIFVGCNSQPAGQLDTQANANLGRQEDYSIASTDQKQFLTTYIADAEEVSADVENYRLTVKMSVEELSDITMNGIIEPTETGFNLAMKLDANEEGIKSSAGVYIKDRVVAIEYGGALKDQANTLNIGSKFKTTLPQDIAEESVESVDMFSTFNLDYICEQLQTLDFESENITLKINTTDNLKRFEITQTDNSTDTPLEMKMYLVFENDKLIQCKNVFSVVYMQMDYEITIEKCNEAIEYPNLDNFTTLTYDMFEFYQNLQNPDVE